MLIAIIIGLVVISVVATLIALRVKRTRLDSLSNNIRSLSTMQVELFGRIMNFLGRQRQEARPPAGHIEWVSKELREKAHMLLAEAESQVDSNNKSTLKSLKESWYEVEEGLDSAFDSYRKRAADYNSTLQTLPASILARLLNYQRQPQLN